MSLFFVGYYRTYPGVHRFCSTEQRGGYALIKGGCMPDFDFTQVAIGGVALVYLLPRLIEFIKTVFGLSGKARVWTLAGALGFFFAGAAAAISEGLVPDVAMPWINVVMMALGGLVAACAAIGDYELKRKE